MTTETKENKPRRKLTILEIILVSTVIFFIGVGFGDLIITQAVDVICGGVK